MRLEKTRAAVKIWDEKKDTLAKRIVATTTEIEFREAWEAEAKEIDLVREAFAIDTHDINSKENAYLIHPDDSWLRRWLINDVTKS